MKQRQCRSDLRSASAPHTVHEQECHYALIKFRPRCGWVCNIQPSWRLITVHQRRAIQSNTPACRIKTQRLAFKYRREPVIYSDGVLQLSEMQLLHYMLMPLIERCVYKPFLTAEPL